MNVNFEAIEKAWFKPKNKILFTKEELELLEDVFGLAIDECPSEDIKKINELEQKIKTYGRAWFKPKKDKPNDKIWENRWNELKNWLIIHQGWYDENTCEIMQDEPYIEDILNEMEDIEKVINKPKKNVLDELEEYTKSEYESLNKKGVGYFARHGVENYIVGRYETLEDILDKIQELKKEMR